MAITWSATGLPDGLTINPTTGVISGIPSVIAVFTPTITATNGQSIDSEVVEIDVGEDLGNTGGGSQGSATSQPGLAQPGLEQPGHI